MGNKIKYYTIIIMYEVKVKVRESNWEKEREKKEIINKGNHSRRIKLNCSYTQCIEFKFMIMWLWEKKKK